MNQRSCLNVFILVAIIKLVHPTMKSLWKFQVWARFQQNVQKIYSKSLNESLGRKWKAAQQSQEKEKAKSKGKSKKKKKFLCYTCLHFKIHILDYE